jgi:hypothetical protein
LYSFRWERLSDDDDQARLSLSLSREMITFFSTTPTYLQSSPEYLLSAC